MNSMKLPVRDSTGTICGEVELSSFDVISNRRGTQALHEHVVAIRAANRSGRASTKTMGEVAGSGKKPWRQKGTGRARAGSFASPLWRGGGVVFGPKPRDFSKKVGKRVRKLALRKAVSERVNSGEVVVIEDLGLGSPKTSQLMGLLNSLGLRGSTLIILADSDRNAVLASRNIDRVQLATAQTLSAYEMLNADKILVTRDALIKLEKRLIDA